MTIDTQPDRTALRLAAVSDPIHPTRHDPSSKPPAAPPEAPEPKPAASTATDTFSAFASFSG